MSIITIFSYDLLAAIPVVPQEAGINPYLVTAIGALASALVWWVITSRQRDDRRITKQEAREDKALERKEKREDDDRNYARDQDAQRHQAIVGAITNAEDTMSEKVGGVTKKIDTVHGMAETNARDIIEVKADIKHLQNETKK